MGFCSGCWNTWGRLHGSSGWSSYLAALEELSSSFILSFGGLVLHLSPPPPHPLFRPALSANMLDNDKYSIFKFGIEALACVVATACLFLSRSWLKEIISRSPSRLCCDPCVGGGASREHRGADEALGMPAGGEEPGAAEGESRWRRPQCHDMVFSTMYNLVHTGTPNFRWCPRAGFFLSYHVDVTFTWNHAFLGGSVFCLVGQKPRLHPWRCGTIGTRWSHLSSTGFETPDLRF